MFARFYDFVLLGLVLAPTGGLQRMITNSDGMGCNGSNPAGSSAWWWVVPVFSLLGAVLAWVSAARARHSAEAVGRCRFLAWYTANRDNESGQYRQMVTVRNAGPADAINVGIVIHGAEGYFASVHHGDPFPPGAVWSSVTDIAALDASTTVVDVPWVEIGQTRLIRWTFHRNTYLQGDLLPESMHGISEANGLPVLFVSAVDMHGKCRWTKPWRLLHRPPR